MTLKHRRKFTREFKLQVLAEKGEATLMTTRRPSPS